MKFGIWAVGVLACHLKLILCQKMLQERLKQFDVSMNTITTLKNSCHKQMLSGLRSMQNRIPMIPSYVTQLPTGKEAGTFVAVDLGGTNFRAAIIAFHSGTYDMVGTVSLPIPDELKVGASHAPLFEFMAGQVVKLVELNIKTNQMIKLALTFSYPVMQTQLSEGFLVNWAKEINLPSAVGKNVVELFQNSLNAIMKEHNLSIQVAAIMNDTVAQVLAYRWRDPSVLVGCIFGTGTNGGLIIPTNEAFLNPDKIANFEQYKDMPMIINTEWGSFYDEDLFPNTHYDDLVDKRSVNPGYQKFEKLISGFYIPEIIKVFIEEEYPDIYSKWSEKLTAKFLCNLLDRTQSNDIESSAERLDSMANNCNEQSGKASVNRLDTFNCKHAHGADELDIIRTVAYAVLRRSAKISAIPIVAALEVTGKPKGEYVVSFDGALYHKSKLFQTILHQTIQEMLDNFLPRIVHDSELSCTLVGGAVLIASMESEHERSIAKE